MRKFGKPVDLTEGSIVKGILTFTLPVFIGQVLQQFYNLADAWVVGNFADNAAFAAVSSAGNIIFLITGFFGGLATGGGVIISRYFGAKDGDNVRKAVHNNVLMGLICSVIGTIIGLLLTPQILKWIDTPDTVMPESLTYFRIYFGGIVTIIMYNIFMSIMRALGDSIRPLFYLMVSSVVNVGLDILLVAGFSMGVRGAAIATIFSQGLAAALCVIRMLRANDYSHISIKELKLNGHIMREVLAQGLPSGIQMSVISIGNIVIQANINSFGEYAMSGQGAYAKIEGFAFLPITCMSMALPTFVSQNLGAKKYDRAKKGAIFGILFGVIFAELIGVLIKTLASETISIFTQEPEAIKYGLIQSGITTLFYFLLAFSHCAAGVLRGCGKAIIPMGAMLASWCIIRIIYVTVFIRIFPVFETISWAYPITWSISSVFLLIYLLTSDWVHAYDRQIKK